MVRVCDQVLVVVRRPLGEGVSTKSLVNYNKVVLGMYTTGTLIHRLDPMKDHSFPHDNVVHS